MTLYANLKAIPAAVRSGRPVYVTMRFMPPTMVAAQIAFSPPMTFETPATIYFIKPSSEFVAEHI